MVTYCECSSCFLSLFITFMITMQIRAGKYRLWDMGMREEPDFQSYDLRSCCSVSQWDWETTPAQHPKMKMYLSFHSVCFDTSGNSLFTRFNGERKSNKLVKKKNTKPPQQPLLHYKVGRKGKRAVLLGDSLDEGHKSSSVYKMTLVAPTRTRTLEAAQAKRLRAVAWFDFSSALVCPWTLEERKCQTFVRIQWTRVAD